MPAAKAATASSNTATASLFGIDNPPTNDPGYGEPAPAEHGRRHHDQTSYVPVKTSYVPVQEEI